MEPLVLASLLALFAVLGGIVVYFVLIYNRLQALKNGGDATLAQVTVALKKRLDLISKLVSAVKGYAKFEKETLESVTRLRAGIGNAGPAELGQINAQSRSILGNIMVVAEKYPELKASETVLVLMKSISDVEDEISRHRYTYNNIVQEFDTMLETIPSRFVASLGGFKKKEYFEFEEGTPEQPKVQLN